MTGCDTQKEIINSHFCEAHCMCRILWKNYGTIVVYKWLYSVFIYGLHSISTSSGPKKLIKAYLLHCYIVFQNYLDNDTICVILPLYSTTTDLK